MSEPTPDPSRSDVSIHLDRATFEQLQAQADEAGVSVEDLVAGLVAELQAADVPATEVTEDDLRG